MHTHVNTRTVLDERTLTLAEAASSLPRRGGRRLHISTIWRWSRRGIRGVRLEAIRLGGQWITSVEALDRFGRALAALDDIGGEPAPPRASSRPRTAGRREQEVAAAESRLARAGF